MGEADTTYYRPRLPHYQPLYATFFVTFRLAGSLPNQIIIQLKEEHGLNCKNDLSIKDPEEKKRRQDEERKKYFGRFEEYLDRVATGPHWLTDERIAAIVSDAMHYRDEKVYELLAFCIMPNHVHVVFSVERFAAVARRDSSRYIATDIVGNLKWYTAMEANKILHRQGQFWQHESYDHVVRNGAELERIIFYVLDNPVKAGFISDWKDWKWSYCKYEM
jgi:REP element-mobilizing transposase RayT